MASTATATTDMSTRSHAADPSLSSNEVFGEHHSPEPMESDLSHVAGGDDMAHPDDDRREWDASKVPPSQFQKRKGSIYSTPSSRDAHLSGSDRDKAYFDKLREKGWLKSNQHGHTQQGQQHK